MGEIIRFEVQGRPVPYCRTTQRQKYVDPRYFRYQEYKNAVGWFGRLATKERLSGDLSVQAIFYMTGKRRVDLDNLLKGLIDGLNKVCFDDDSQIVEVIARKVRVDKTTEQRAEIMIKSI